HIRGLSCDQRPPPERTPISLGEENGFKPFSASAMGCLRSNFNAAKKRQLLDLRELASATEKDTEDYATGCIMPKSFTGFTSHKC
ncbi:hypothetical protein N9V48_00645, partial [Planktomarina temperata]|nr:hypothetical protein [Planktomarina temperata]